ncbi:MAG TPA: response regulator transcription factor [Planctomycetota bacterium]|mgnify:CR=1 FL=1|nr:response regulator transcription factor [Planctomycetota bacterium]HRR79312.1 response regulator transcription factor [Planctomycetota bacterium]
MGNAGKKRILLTDDDPDIVEALKTVLEASGFEVDTAPNGQECLRKLRASKPDLLILDVMMTTETEGFHVAYEIRHDPKLRDLPVLMLTAIEQKTGFKFSPTSDEDYLPVEQFVTKPIEPDELLKRVNELLSKSAGAN